MLRFVFAAVLALLPCVSSAQAPWDAAKKVAGDAATGNVEKEVNRRLLDEARKNQCSFKSGTAELAPGCGPKAAKLANVLIDAKKRLNAAGVKNFKFVVSGHTDSTGDAAKNKALSAQRAEVMVKELVAKGIPQGDVESVGMGSERPLVTPDDTPRRRRRTAATRSRSSSSHCWQRPLRVHGRPVRGPARVAEETGQ